MGAFARIGAFASVWPAFLAFTTGGVLAQTSARSVKAIGDPATTFTLTGKALAVASSDPVVLKYARRRRLLIVCYNEAFQPIVGSPEFESSYPYNNTYWPTDASSVTLHLKANVAPRVAWCGIYREQAGAVFYIQFAYAALTSSARKRLGRALSRAQAIARAELDGDWDIIYNFVLNQYPPYVGVMTTFPSAQTVYEDVDAPHADIELSARLLYAPTFADAQLHDTT